MKNTLPKSVLWLMLVGTTITCFAGPLGLIRVQEVIIGTADLNKANQTWQKLVAPTPPTGANLWRLGDGPAIRLVQADTDRLQGLVVVVASLPTARDFLEKKELLGASADTELMIVPAKIRGLNIRLALDGKS